MLLIIFDCAKATASVCLYFEVHQPIRLNRFSVFNIGNKNSNSSYFKSKLNQEIFEKVARKCYLPTNNLLLNLINENDGRFKISLPSWISFSDEELELELTPGADNGGDYTIYILALDPGGLKDSLEVNIEVITPEGFDTKFQEPEISIYPNPANKYLNIDCNHNIRDIMVYDFKGKLIYYCADDCKKINVAGIETGIYILKVTTDKTTYIEKLVIH